MRVVGNMTKKKIKVWNVKKLTERFKAWKLENFPGTSGGMGIIIIFYILRIWNKIIKSKEKKKKKKKRKWILQIIFKFHECWQMRNKKVNLFWFNEILLHDKKLNYMSKLSIYCHLSKPSNWNKNRNKMLDYESNTKSPIGSNLRKRTSWWAWSIK